MWFVSGSVPVQCDCHICGFCVKQLGGDAQIYFHWEIDIKSQCKNDDIYTQDVN